MCSDPLAIPFIIATQQSLRTGYVMRARMIRSLPSTTAWAIYYGPEDRQCANRPYSPEPKLMASIASNESNIGEVRNRYFPGSSAGPRRQGVSFPENGRLLGT